MNSATSRRSAVCRTRPKSNSACSSSHRSLASADATHPTGLLLDLEGVPALDADELTWLSDLSIAAMLEGVRPALVGVGAELLNQLDDQYVHGGSSAALLHALVLTVRRSS